MLKINCMHWFFPTSVFFLFLLYHSCIFSATFWKKEDRAFTSSPGVSNLPIHMKFLKPKGRVFWKSERRTCLYPHYFFSHQFDGFCILFFIYLTTSQLFFFSDGRPNSFFKPSNQTGFLMSIPY